MVESTHEAQVLGPTCFTAIDLDDAATLEALLPLWHIPGHADIRNRLAETRDRHPHTPPEDHEPELSELLAELDAAERGRRGAQLHLLRAGVEHYAEGDSLGVVQTVIDSLTPGTLWEALPAALRLTSDEQWRELGRRPVPRLGVMTPLPDLDPALLEAFVIASITRSELLSADQPSLEFVEGQANQLLAAIGRVRSNHRDLLVDLGVPEKQIDSRARTFAESVETVKAEAQRHRQDDVIKTPIDHSTVTSQLREYARRGFHEDDITMGLLAWAGRAAAPPAPHQSEVLAAAAVWVDRRLLVGSADLTTVRLHLGRLLAEQLLRALLYAAHQAAPAQDAVTTAGEPSCGRGRSTGRPCGRFPRDRDRSLHSNRSRPGGSHWRERDRRPAVASGHDWRR
jgi:hypothetical protein